MALSWSIAERIAPDTRSGVREGQPLQAGERFGPYEILGELGQGATSRVYRALGPGGLCALKVLRDALDTERRERFGREGRLAAGLDHPGIVRLQDGGEVEGTPFLVYELVDGGVSFRDWLQRQDLRGRVRALRKVAEALGHAHARGVVHRDVKLANVLVDGAGVIKLTDFGLGLGGDLERMTRSGTVVGTPRTMSPEQLAGARALTPASDVWSVGVLLYQALSGQHPFPAEGIVQLRQQVASQRAPSVDRAQPQTPRALTAVVERALGRVPAERWPDGRALADALRACERHVPAAPGPALPAQRESSGSSLRLPLPLGPHEPFDLLEVIGRGGMGLVYRARDPAAREVAVKVLLGDQAQRRLERFRREGELTANLSHENVLRVHGTGVLDDVPYLVYELVPGARTLAELLDRRDLRRGLRLLRDAARGLGYAHERGVVHRDVKPDNILVGADGRVRVADFGLAAAEGLDRLTRTGALVGTPQYMAPELIAGERERVGPPADVWALGVILYDLLTGQLPFPCESLVELAATVTSLTEAPSPRALDPAVPEPLDAICRRALAPDPAQRYAGGDAFAADVDAYLSGGQVAVAPRRTRGPALAAAVALGVVLLGGVAALTQARSAGPDDATPAPTPTPSATPSARPRDPEAAWRAALGQTNPRAQVAAVQAFRREFPGHPLDAEARQFLLERRHAYRVATLAHPDGERTLGDFRGEEVLTVSTDRALVRWSLAGERLGARSLPRLPVHPGRTPSDLEALTCWAGGVAIGAARGPLYLLPDGGEPYLDERYQEVLDLALFPDRKRLALGTRGGQVVILPLDTQGVGGLVAQLVGETDYPTRRLALSPAGRFLAAAASQDLDETGTSTGAQLELWRLADKDRLFHDRFPSIPRCAAFLGEGRLFVGDSGGRIQLFEVETGARVPGVEFDGRGPEDQLRAAFAHRGSVKALAVANGRLYSAGNDDTRPGYRSTLRAWDLATQEPLTPEFPLRPAVTNLTVSPDGRSLLVSADGGPAELWGLEVVDVR